MTTKEFEAVTDAIYDVAKNNSDELYEAIIYEWLKNMVVKEKKK